MVSLLAHLEVDLELTNSHERNERCKNQDDKMALRLLLQLSRE